MSLNQFQAIIHHQQTKDDMGLSAEEAVNAIGNRYEMVLIASLRVRELKRGDKPRVICKNGPIITALKEIESGKVGKEYLRLVGKYSRVKGSVQQP